MASEELDGMKKRFRSLQSFLDYSEDDQSREPTPKAKAQVSGILDEFPAIVQKITNPEDDIGEDITEDIPVEEEYIEDIEEDVSPVIHIHEMQIPPESRSNQSPISPTANISVEISKSDVTIQTDSLNISNELSVPPLPSQPSVPKHFTQTKKKKHQELIEYPVSVAYALKIIDECMNREMSNLLDEVNRHDNFVANYKNKLIQLNNQ
jgi:hypothetical protein